MRYIYSAAGLLLIVLGIAGLTFLRKAQSSPELARVNDRVITAAQFETAYKESCDVTPMPLDRKRFLDNQITKEVLIQEARRRELDLKEPFRRSIQNYYEQTLLRNLTQERMSEVKVSVSEDEILSYYKKMGRAYELRVAKLPTEREAQEAIRNFPAEKAETRILHLEEFPPAMLDEIMSLKEGEVLRRTFPGERGFLVLRLEGYKTRAVAPLEKLHEEIKNALEEKKRAGEMEKWLEGLKSKARIKINEAMLKKED